MEKALATHSSILAWKIPGTGALQYLVWKISWTEEPKVAKRQG